MSLVSIFINGCSSNSEIDPDFVKCMEQNPREKRIQNSIKIESNFANEIKLIKQIKKDFDIKYQIVGSVPRKTANCNSDFDIKIFVGKKKSKSIIKILENNGFSRKKKITETCNVFEAFTKEINNLNLDLSLHYCVPEIDNKWNINPEISENVKDIIFCTNTIIKKNNQNLKCATHKDISINAGEFNDVYVKEKLNTKNK